ncbi:MAG: hypothetical protein ILA52_01150 [Alphaproteobacteria bacterium]|nr:hypothetical protein [Alphaproteobacteria bacterium]
MENSLEAIQKRAIIEKKIITYYAIKLNVRYRRKSIFATKRETFSILVRRGTSDYQFLLYRAAEKLNLGDEIYVEPSGQEWSTIIHHDFLSRIYNRFFG